jgi:hypothetical protein
MLMRGGTLSARVDARISRTTPSPVSILPIQVERPGCPASACPAPETRTYTPGSPSSVIPSNTSKQIRYCRSCPERTHPISCPNGTGEWVRKRGNPVDYRVPLLRLRLASCGVPTATKREGVEFCDIRIRNGNAESLGDAFRSHPADDFRLKERNFTHDRIITVTFYCRHYRGLRNTNQEYIPRKAT